MTTLKFADSHNMVAFLTKSAESEGFEQIVDFLNASSIRYALTMNPTIYALCIKQFWATVKMKIVNGEVQLKALVDGRKIIITEATIRRDLQLEDAEGIDCLSNVTIFEQLSLMGYEKLSQKLTFYKAFFSPQWKFLIHTILQCLSAKTTALNEFSSTMASAIICLATNQKFIFSKYIFESMVKNLENVSVKFLIYPRFIQVFLDNQLEEMATHNRTYIAPSHTKKIFANMRRQGKDFSGRVTPLFPTMVVQAQEEIGEGSAMPTDPHHTPITTQPSSSQPQRKQKSRRPKEEDAEIPQSSVPSDSTNVADEAINEEPSMQLKELMDFCNQLQQRVLDLENTKTTQAKEITSLKLRVKRLEKKGGSRTHKLKRLYKVGRSARVVSFDEASLGDQEDASKQGRKIDDICKDAEITLIDETQGRHDDDIMFMVSNFVDEEVFVAEQGVPDAAQVNTVVVNTASTILVSATTITKDEITLAQALAELKSVKPKDKGKGIMVEEPLKMKKKDQINFDEQEAIRLQAKFDEEAKIETNYELAQRLQAEEQEELTVDEKATLMEAQRLEEQTELVEGSEMEESSKKEKIAQESSSKRVGDELEQENAKKQKEGDDQEAAKMKEVIKIIPDEEEVAVDAIPLATKPPSIIDWKIVKEGKIIYYQIIRVDGSSKRGGL
ncbi:hypothetical protein Tco_1127409 [Tanacetum coccineum]